MLNYDLERVRKAVAYLVADSYTPHHLRKLRSTVQRPRALPFKGDAEVLNELLVVGRQSREAMENLIHVAEFKRDTRNDYQREFMAAKRRRRAKAIALEELLVERKLGNTDRAFLIQKQEAVWNKELDQFLARAGDIEWRAKNDKRREFWALKERELDQLIEEAKNQPVVHRKAPKRVVVVPRPEPTTAIGIKLAQAQRRAAR